MNSKRNPGLKVVQRAAHTDVALRLGSSFSSMMCDVKPLVQQRYFFPKKRHYLSPANKQLRASVRELNLQALWEDTLPMIELKQLIVGLERIPAQLRQSGIFDVSAVRTWHLDLHACSRRCSRVYLARELLRIEALGKPAFLRVVCGNGQGILRRWVPSWLWATPQVLSLRADGPPDVPDAALRVGLCAVRR